MKAGTGVEKIFDEVRARVPRLTEDRPLSQDIEAIAAAIREGRFEVWAHRIPAGGTLEIVSL